LEVNLVLIKAQCAKCAVKLEKKRVVLKMEMALIFAQQIRAGNNWVG